MTRSLTTSRITAAWFFVATIPFGLVLFAIHVAGSRFTDDGTIHACLGLQQARTTRMSD
jgi:hypothetical protein